MPETITAYAVLHPDEGVYGFYQQRDFAARVADLKPGRYLVPLTGIIPDPPKTVTLEGVTYTKGANGMWGSLGYIFDAALDRIWELENPQA